MPVVSWPSTLPQTILAEGYNQSAANVLLRSQPDVGPAMVRRRASAGVEPVSGKEWMTPAELGYLRTFYDTTLIGGSLRFSWKDPVTEAAVEFRFTEPPSWIRAGVGFFVQLGLEILP